MSCKVFDCSGGKAVEHKFESIGLYLCKKDLKSVKERLKSVVVDSPEYWHLIGKMEGIETTIQRLSDV